MDYYQTLELDYKTANYSDICNQFRKLAIVWHPMKSRDSVG